MQVTIGTHTFRYPDSAEDLLLSEWIDFMRVYGLQLDEYAEQIDGMAPGIERALDAMQLYAERAYAVASYFAGLDLEEAKQAFPLPEVTRLYREHFRQCFDTEASGRLYLWNGTEYILPDAQLSQASLVTFGEVIDSKVMLHNAKTLEWTRWELIRMLCAIFLRPADMPYDESFAFLDSPRAAAMDALPMRGAMLVSGWYEGLNIFLEQAFTIFQESSLATGRNMKRHFDYWGWVNFLKTIAKTKVFDIPGSGMNSIQAARAAKAYDVLMYASEEKEYGEAQAADYESKNKR